MIATATSEAQGTPPGMNALLFRTGQQLRIQTREEFSLTINKRKEFIDNQQVRTCMPARMHGRAGPGEEEEGGMWGASGGAGCGRERGRRAGGRSDETLPVVNVLESRDI